MINRLQDVRTAAAVSQSELAQATGYSVKTVWATEVGSNRPTLRAQLAFADALGESAPDLFWGTCGWPPEWRARKVRERRRTLKMTLQELSLRSGVSYSTLQPIEATPGRNVGAGVMERIAAALDSTVPELFFAPEAE